MEASFRISTGVTRLATWSFVSRAHAQDLRREAISLYAALGSRDPVESILDRAKWGWTRSKSATSRYRRTSSPGLVVVTEESIPSAYWLPQPPKLDRQALLRELKSRKEVPGAALANAQCILVVRTK
jgi:hypothetical protein